MRTQKELVTEKFEDKTKCLDTFNNDKDEQYLQSIRKIKKSNAVPLIVPKILEKI